MMVLLEEHHLTMLYSLISSMAWYEGHSQGPSGDFSVTVAYTQSLWVILTRASLTCSTQPSRKETFSSGKRKCFFSNLEKTKVFGPFWNMCRKTVVINRLWKIPSVVRYIQWHQRILVCLRVWQNPAHTDSDTHKTDFHAMVSWTFPLYK